MLMEPRGRDDVLALTRSDLVASVDAYRLASRSPAGWALLAGGFVSVLAGAVGATLAETLDWPSWSAPAFVLAGIGATVYFLGVSIRRQRQALARTQWHCPQCATLLIGAAGLNPLARAEIAIASGCCPSCAHPLFASSAAEASGT